MSAVHRLLAVFNMLLYYMVRCGVRLKKILLNRAYYARLVHWGSSPRQTLLLFHFHTRPGKARYQVAAGGGSVGWLAE